MEEEKDPNVFFLPENREERPCTKKILEYEGKAWTFEIYDEISTKEYNDIVKSLYSTDLNGRPKKDTDRYMRTLIKTFVKKAPFELTEKNLINLKATAWEKIIRLLPYNPMTLGVTEEDKKKLSEKLDTVP